MKPRLYFCGLWAFLFQLALFAGFLARDEGMLALADLVAVGAFSLLVAFQVRMLVEELIAEHEKKKNKEEGCSTKS